MVAVTGRHHVIDGELFATCDSLGRFKDLAPGADGIFLAVASLRLWEAHCSGPTYPTLRARQAEAEGESVLPLILKEC